MPCMPLSEACRFAGRSNRDKSADRAGIRGEILMGDSLHVLRRDVADPFKKLIDVPPTRAYRLGLA